MSAVALRGAGRRFPVLLALLGALFWVLARDVVMQVAPEVVLGVATRELATPGPVQGAEGGLCVGCGASALGAEALRLKLLRGGFVAGGGALPPPQLVLAGGGLQVKHEIGNMLFLFASLWGIDAARNGAPAAAHRWRVVAGGGVDGVGARQAGQVGRAVGWVAARLVQGRCGNGALREVLRAGGGGALGGGGWEAGGSKARAPAQCKCFAREAGFARFDCGLVTGAGYSCTNSSGGRISSSSSSSSSGAKLCPISEVSGYLQSWRYGVLRRRCALFDPPSPFSLILHASVLCCATVQTGISALCAARCGPSSAPCSFPACGTAAAAVARRSWRHFEWGRMIMR